MRHRGSAFDRFARQVARFAGHPLAFAGAVLLILVWLLAGPIFLFSSTWQLVINTATTIVTFLMVFLIQNTQNRDGEALQIKLDEVIRAAEGAHNALLDLEELSESELAKFRERYVAMAREARDELRSDESADVGSPVIALTERD